MNEKDVVNKMKKLEDSINTIYQYSNLYKRLPVLGVITLLIILIYFSVKLIIEIYEFNTLNNGFYIDGIVIVISFLFLSIFLIVSGIYINRATKYRKVKNWDSELNEGIPGILKIMENEDWEEILKEIRKAKSAYIFRSIFNFIIIWVAVGIILSFSMELLFPSFFALNTNVNLLVSFSSFIITIVLQEKTLKSEFNSLWNFENILNNIWRLYLEYQREKSQF